MFGIFSGKKKCATFAGNAYHNNYDHEKNNLLPKVKIIFKRSIFIGDEFYFKIPLYPHGRGG